jgi:hypothetical protein
VWWNGYSFKKSRKYPVYETGIVPLSFFFDKKESGQRKSLHSNAMEAYPLVNEI